MARNETGGSINCPVHQCAKPRWSIVRVYTTDHTAASDVTGPFPPARVVSGTCSQSLTSENGLSCSHSASSPLKTMRLPFWHFHEVRFPLSHNRKHANMTSKFFAGSCASVKNQHERTWPYHPQANIIKPVYRNLKLSSAHTERRKLSREAGGKSRLLRALPSIAQQASHLLFWILGGNCLFGFARAKRRPARLPLCSESPQTPLWMPWRARNS